MKHRVTCMLFLLVVAVELIGCSQSSTKPGAEPAVTDAIDVYIYGYPLVTMDMTRKLMTNVATVEGSRGPVGQLIKLRTYPAVDDHAVLYEHLVPHPNRLPVGLPRVSAAEAM